MWPHRNWQCLQWTKDKRDELKRERDRKIFDLWLQCYSQREIAEKLDIALGTVNEVIEVFKNGNIAKIEHPHDFTPQLYDVWTFPKYT